MDFEKPSTFVSIRADLPSTELPLAISDMAAIVKEHLDIFLAHPEAFSGLPYAQSQLLFADLEVFLEPSKLAKSGKTSYILVIPAGMQQSAVDDISDLGMQFHSSVAPKGSHTMIYRTAVGNTLSDMSSIVERSISILISLSSLPAAFRVADAVYMWMTAMLPMFQLEFGCRKVKLMPAKSITEKERFLSEPIAGNPVLTGLTAITIPDFHYGDPSPA